MQAIDAEQVARRFFIGLAQTPGFCALTVSSSSDKVSSELNSSSQHFNVFVAIIQLFAGKPKSSGVIAGRRGFPAGI